MADNLHPEIAAITAIATGVIVNFSKRWGFDPTINDAVNISIFVGWICARLAKRFFPDDPKVSD